MLKNLHKIISKKKKTKIEKSGPKCSHKSIVVVTIKFAIK